MSHDVSNSIIYIYVIYNHIAANNMDLFTARAYMQQQQLHFQKFTSRISHSYIIWHFYHQWTREAE